MPSDHTDPFVEFRGPLLREHIDVIDAIAQATPGATRVSIVRDWIAEKVDQEIKKATLISRVLPRNGNVADGMRKTSGVESEKSYQQVLSEMEQRLIAKITKG